MKISAKATCRTKGAGRRATPAGCEACPLACERATKEPAFAKRRLTQRVHDRRTAQSVELSTEGNRFAVEYAEFFATEGTEDTER